MTLQLSTAIRNARLNAIKTTIGPSPTLKIATGAVPSNCAASDTGTVVATLALPSSWMNDAAGGSMSMSGTWSDNSADANGNSGYFRIYSSDGTCHIQGTVTLTGGGGDLQVDNVVFAAGQAFSITSFTLTDGNA